MSEIGSGEYFWDEFEFMESLHLEKSHGVILLESFDSYLGFNSTLFDKDYEQEYDCEIPVGWEDGIQDYWEDDIEEFSLSEGPFFDEEDDEGFLESQDLFPNETIENVSLQPFEDEDDNMFNLEACRGAIIYKLAWDVPNVFPASESNGLVGWSRGCEENHGRSRGFRSYNMLGRQMVGPWQRLLKGFGVRPGLSKGLGVRLVRCRPQPKPPWLFMGCSIAYESEPSRYDFPFFPLSLPFPRDTIGMFTSDFLT